MARKRLASAPSSRSRGTPSGRLSWVLLCCWLLAFLNNGGGGNNGQNVEPRHVRPWSGGADAANVTVDLSQVPEDTSLGRLARACSDYCHAGVDGLDLWMSFKEVCVTSSTPGFLKQMMATGRKGSAASLSSASSRQPSSMSHRNSSPAAAVDSGIYSATTQQAAWSLPPSILFVSAVSTLGLFAGFRMGSGVVSVPKAALLPLL